MPEILYNRVINKNNSEISGACSGAVQPQMEVSMENSIITISREYGSGGREIARKTAERLGIPFYDRDLIDKAAQESGFTPEFVAEREQRLGNNFLYNFALGGIYGLAYPRKPEMKELPVAEQIFLAQKKVIEDLAEQGPCIFVGRCADYILRNKPKILKVFIYADPKERVSRSIEKYGQMAEQAEELIRHIDKQRRLHYEAYTVQEWGDRNNYHLMLDSQAFGVEGCVDIICGAVLSLDKKPSP